MLLNRNLPWRAKARPRLGPTQVNGLDAAVGAVVVDDRARATAAQIDQLHVNRAGPRLPNEPSAMSSLPPTASLSSTKPVQAPICEAISMPSSTTKPNQIRPVKWRLLRAHGAHLRPVRTRTNAADADAAADVAAVAVVSLRKGPPSNPLFKAISTTSRMLMTMSMRWLSMAEHRGRQLRRERVGCPPASGSTPTISTTTRMMTTTANWPLGLCIVVFPRGKKPLM